MNYSGGTIQDLILADKRDVSQSQKVIQDLHSLIKEQNSQLDKAFKEVERLQKELEGSKSEPQMEDSEEETLSTNKVPKKKKS
jgi:hypothetical protein